MTQPEYENHIPVLKNEVLSLLNIKPSGVYADCTMGYGGHGRAILDKLNKDATYVGIDKDDYAISKSREWTSKYNSKIIVVKDDYKNFKYISQNLNIGAYDGILIDMGVSSVQLDDEARGFSYHNDGTLDMRMDTSSSFSAYDIVNYYDETELSKIIFKYGEEKHARKIARAICASRQNGHIETTLQLAEIIKNAYPAKERFAGKHPARKTFQAIRIMTNNELEGLSETVKDMADLLNIGGVLAVITFHSLEDRIIKEAFATLSAGCTCPKDFPICVCGARKDLKLLTKKPITASEDELNNNLRSRSAKLRAIIKTGY
ncbi:MAG: 16S rRNA (cytosine(1402)-N(4))-methyltransferase RsmH [Eubacteriaceae bacterium]|nr:16S rRNA (cytosine(1402)-N(4))-methyltransferase RsmH [Eubacteriaceae bacterium]